MTRAQNNKVPPAPSEVTRWAFDEVAGTYSSAAEAVAKLRMAANKGCRLVGGMANVPLPLGHELQVTVVPIEETSLYPLNSHAKAIVKGVAAIEKLKPEEREEIARWGIGKAIINTLAVAAGAA